MNVVHELFSHLDPVVLPGIPLFLIAIGLEVGINAYEKLHLYEFKDSVASITMGLGSLVLDIGVKLSYLLLYFFLFQHRLFDLPNPYGDVVYPFWQIGLTWAVLFFADDFSFYWHHRLSHEVRVLWAAHVNHHSSMNLNFSTALRQSWVELFYKFIFWLWLPLLGFHPIMVMTMMSISLIFQFLQHTSLVKKLGPLEWVFNTPSHHRVHHASNIRYMDRNHAGMLIIWDRMFGTFVEELDNEAPVYGITNNIHTYNPVKIAFHEYNDLFLDVRNAKTFKDKIGYLFNPPGWSPDGPNKTAKYLQHQLKLQEESTNKQ